MLALDARVRLLIPEGSGTRCDFLRDDAQSRDRAPLRGPHPKPDTVIPGAAFGDDGIEVPFDTTTGSAGASAPRLNPDQMMDSPVEDG